MDTVIAVGDNTYAKFEGGVYKVESAVIVGDEARVEVTPENEEVRRLLEARILRDNGLRVVLGKPIDLDEEKHEVRS